MHKLRLQLKRDLYKMKVLMWANDSHQGFFTVVEQVDGEDNNMKLYEVKDIINL